MRRAGGDCGALRTSSGRLPANPARSTARVRAAAGESMRRVRRNRRRNYTITGQVSRARCGADAGGRGRVALV